MNQVELWRDGQQIHGCDQPRKQSVDEIYKDQNLRTKPNECPPIHFGNCSDNMQDFVRWANRVTNANTGETQGPTDAQAAAAFAMFAGGMNIASYISTAVRDAGNEVAEALNRLARAVENSSPAADPEVLTRLRDVARRVGISSTDIMKLSDIGEFPKSVRVAGIPMFRDSDVTKWLADKANSIQ